ncbi:hypothetical protein [Paenibacillus pectinilyticus]|uniref:hypothetical protein n=1 Tax=Paenibacillus pectinilyticus TaxID=512399 RepID=UPI001428D876|nr:hypothetical protein [Paenibacillus pectinilyticus]
MKNLNPLDEIDVFLHTIHDLEGKITTLIHRSNLTETEKAFILEHILIIPGKCSEHE